MLERLRNAIRDVDGFPHEGIVFKDITPVLADAELFRGTIDLLCRAVAGVKIDKVVGIEARGFIFAAAVADRIGAGFVPIRKKGKLPWKCREAAYDLEYGAAAIELHEDAVKPGDTVLLVDDVLATGGTAAAAVNLLNGLGAEIFALSFLIELPSLMGREKLLGNRVMTILNC